MYNTPMTILVNPAGSNSLYISLKLEYLTILNIHTMHTKMGSSEEYMFSLSQ